VAARGPTRASTSTPAPSGARPPPGGHAAPGAVRHAQATYPTYRFAQGDLTTWAGTYDVVCSFETLEHVRNVVAAIDNYYRLLAPGGRLFFSTPNRLFKANGAAFDMAYPTRNIHHLWNFSIDEMVSLLNAAGFRDVQRYGQKHRRPTTDGLWLRYLLSRAEMAAIPGNMRAKVLPARRGLEPRYMVLTATK
jgi:SAM-dependent methyltransferase